MMSCPVTSCLETSYDAMSCHIASHDMISGRCAFVDCDLNCELQVGSLKIFELRSVMFNIDVNSRTIFELQCAS